MGVTWPQAGRVTSPLDPPIRPAKPSTPVTGHHPMTTLVFGHKSPDTDSTGSPILWAWYLNEVKGGDAEAVLLGEPNTEAAFLLTKWDLPKPRIISNVEDGQSCVVVDTNNPAELPANINGADVQAIIDHHKLVGGLETKGPIDITIR